MQRSNIHTVSSRFGNSYAVFNTTYLTSLLDQSQDSTLKTVFILMQSHVLMHITKLRVTEAVRQILYAAFATESQCLKIVFYYAEG
jgi:hypothetical protein